MKASNKSWINFRKTIKHITKVKQQTHVKRNAIGQSEQKRGQSDKVTKRRVTKSRMAALNCNTRAAHSESLWRVADTGEIPGPEGTVPHSVGPVSSSAALRAHEASQDGAGHAAALVLHLKQSNHLSVQLKQSVSLFTRSLRLKLLQCRLHRCSGSSATNITVQPSITHQLVLAVLQRTVKTKEQLTLCVE